MNLTEFLDTVENNPRDIFSLEIRRIEASDFEQIEKLELKIRKKTENPRIDSWLEMRLADVTASILHGLQFRERRDYSGGPLHGLTMDVYYDIDTGILREYIMEEVDLTDADLAE